MNSSIDGTKLAIIVPVYNIENYLSECVRSIQSQSFSDFECILVDDGSTDSSGRLCDEIASQDKRFCVLHKNNGGLSDARNAGLAVARGKYVGFVDGDDWIEPEMFQTLLDAAEKKELEIVCCNVQIVDDHTRESRPEKTLCAFCGDDEVVNWRDLRNNFAPLINISVCNKLFRLDFLRETGETFPVGKRFEDIVFWSHVFFKAERVGCVAKSFYNYRVSRSGSIVQQNDFRGLVPSYEIMVESMRQHNLLPAVKDDLIAFLVLRLVYCFVYSQKAFKTEFYCGMRRLIRECGSYTFHSEHSIVVRFFVWLYLLFSRFPSPVFSFFCVPFFLLNRLSILNGFRRIFNI